jgi:hypothetical protein
VLVASILGLAALLPFSGGVVLAGLGETCTYQEWVEDGVINDNPAPDRFHAFLDAHPDAFLGTRQGNEGELVLRIARDTDAALLDAALALVDPCVTVIVRPEGRPLPDTSTAAAGSKRDVIPWPLGAVLALSFLVAARWSRDRPAPGSVSARPSRGSRPPG